MNNKLWRIAALVVAVVVLFGMIYGRRIFGWQNQHGDRGANRVSAGARKVLYYYDAMNPQHHYGKPGKAPDGMDLVPQYAEDNTSQGASATNISEPSSERKI